MNVKIRHLNIEVTKRCNQRCFYCFNDSGLGSPGSELIPSRWLNILRKLKKEGLESIHLTGGEPFAYRHAVELLAGAQELGLATSILSNGFLVVELAGESPEVFQKLTVAQISLDSMKAETHNQRRGYRRAWQDAVSAIHALRKLGVPVEVSCVVSDTNILDLPAVAEFCQNMQAGLIIRPIISAGRATTQIMPDSFVYDVELCTRSLTENLDARLVSDRFYYVADEREMRPPSWPTDIHTVHHDGRLKFSKSGEINLTVLEA